MTLDIGVLSSADGAEVAALIAAVEAGRLSARIKIVIADRDSPALGLARAAGLYGLFLPRAAFHANQDGFERRLVELLAEAGAETLVLAGFTRPVGPVLAQSFPGRIYGWGQTAAELVAGLTRLGA
ncbi:MAG: hypothetical protein LBP55_00975 [Candidatus Adiutrix sp.]|jgi:phosphoribosylglycinamide formyltransferase-1|nr:hypothetical protein [Candidatus Adiutrix sp.]